MVNAFIDVGYEDDRRIEDLHPEELAQHAANAARALKEPQQHATVSRLHSTVPAPAETLLRDPRPRGGCTLLGRRSGSPAYLKERYGPLGEIVEAYLAAQYDSALALLQHSGGALPPVTRLYWEARIQFARRAVVEAARALLQAWVEVEKLPPASQTRILRRLALLQARMQNDKETETLVRFIDDTEQRLANADPQVRAKLLGLFTQLMDLRTTYQLTQLAGEGDVQDAAVGHEAAVEKIFGQLQDVRLELASSGPSRKARSISLRSAWPR